MNYLEKVINNCKYIYSEINAATLTGAIDVVVVEQPDGSFTCSPFHVRFGKMGVLRSKEKVVDIEINGEPVEIQMKLGESGEAFFVEEVEQDEELVPPHLATSPIPPDTRPFPPYTPSRCEQGEEEEGGVTGEGGAEEAWLAGQARLFKAETVTSGPLPSDFRPIDTTADNLPVSIFTKEDSLSGDDGAEGGAEGGTEGGGVAGVVTALNKRKRRKRSTRKQRNGAPAMRTNSLPFNQPSPDDIFTMDDIDNTNLSETSVGEDVAGVSGEDTSAGGVNTALREPALLPVDTDIHFFSDTEITPGTSPREEMVAPVQSDTEFETNKERDEATTRPSGIHPVHDTNQSWKWGELPTTLAPDHPSHHSQKWMANMLGFMKKTKHMRHENEGVYLSELKLDDPEISSLYLSTLQQRHAVSHHEEVGEEDAESGNGPSLPQSPHSVEGVNLHDVSHLHLDLLPKWWPIEVSLSLCGPGATEEQFSCMQLTYSELVADPSLANSPKLMVRLDNKIITWRQASPLILSLLAFHKPLPHEVVNRICDESLESEDKSSKEPARKVYKSWFSWRKNGEERLPEMKDEVGKAIDEDCKVEALPAEPAEQPILLPASLLIPGSKEEIEIDFKKEDELASGLGEKFRKTLRLTSKQIELLNLQPGANEVEFSVTTAYQGTSKCKCYLFRWKYDDKIVVSDIDGTITKSDVLGHILPIVGKDWAQSGVAKLFTKIKDNGYKLLYLSARAIGQSRLTREYLKSIRQEDLKLPDGPVLLNPTSLLHAFHTEVIEKKPEEFKISCLRDIQALFPTNSKPFYAGYGNKINDVWAYQAVGVPIFRIFTINHRGELKHELTQTFQSTYSNMSTLVDQMFPVAKPSHAEYDFSEFVYWRHPIVDISSLPQL